MKVKVIGVNPIKPQESGLLKETELSPDKALVLRFKNPVGEIQIRIVKEELVVYIGKTVDIDGLKKRLLEAKNNAVNRAGRTQG